MSLARSPENVLDSGLRADLIVRWALLAGAGRDVLDTVVQSSAVNRTRHYLAIMTALWARQASIAAQISVYERRIVERPLKSGKQRSTALRHLINTDDITSDTLRVSPVLICAMPKSASTYLCALLATLTGRPMTTPHSLNDPLGVSFDQLGFLRSVARSAIVHSHLDANTRTLAMVRLLNLKPIVQTRNIFDALASYLDHSAKKAHPGSNLAPLSEQQRRRIGILRMARHYVDLVASWSLAPPDIQTLWVDYEAVRLNPKDVIRSVLGHVGIAIPDGRIESAVESADPFEASPEARSRMRVNKAVPHRGSMFSDDEKAWVRTLYAAYPGVDFARIDS